MQQPPFRAHDDVRYHSGHDRVGSVPAIPDCRTISTHSTKHRGRKRMTIKHKRLLLLSPAASLAPGLAAVPALGIDVSRLDVTRESPGDWVTYHGTYRSYHFSPLDQINASNVKQLKVAWMHQPGRSTRGLQGMPLVADGTLYYAGSYSRMFALDGATGRVKWTFFPKLDEDLIKAQTHTPYNRGIALGHGKLYIGTVDGRLIALDMQ